MALSARGRSIYGWTVSDLIPPAEIIGVFSVLESLVTGSLTKWVTHWLFDDFYGLSCADDESVGGGSQVCYISEED